MIIGLIIQVLSLLCYVTIPSGNLNIAILSIALFAVGFGIFKSFIDSLLAEVTEGDERAGIYSIVNTMTCIFTALIALISGNLYVLNPKLLYVGAIIILLICIVLLMVLLSKNGKNMIKSK